MGRFASRCARDQMIKARGHILSYTKWKQSELSEGCLIFHYLCSLVLSSEPLGTCQVLSCPSTDWCCRKQTKQSHLTTFQHIKQPLFELAFWEHFTNPREALLLCFDLKQHMNVTTDSIHIFNFAGFGEKHQRSELCLG